MNTPHSPRAIFAVTGADRLTFLQGLLTQDVLPLAGADGLRYGALLTPQGKYLADMFILMQGGALYLDMDAHLAPATVQRLAMYRLRADVQITPSDISVARGLGAPPQGAWADPRHAALGWRQYGGGVDETAVDWDALRVAHGIPQSGIELIPNDSYILEMGLDRLNGVSFRKGCYVGQEVTARMRHKTELKKGLLRVGLDGAAPIGTPITDGARTLGTLYTSNGAQALAYVRFDWAQAAMQAGGMQAGGARLHLLPE